MLQSKQKPQYILKRKPCNAGVCFSPVYCRTETQREGIKEKEGKQGEERVWKEEERGRGKKMHLHAHALTSLATH